MGFDFIVIVPLLLSCCSFFYIFGRGVSLFGGFQCPPVDGWSTASCDFGALTGGDECMFFYSTIFPPPLILDCLETKTFKLSEK